LVIVRFQELPFCLWNCHGIQPQYFRQPAWLHTPSVHGWPPAGWTNLGGLYGRDLPPFLSFMGRKVQSFSEKGPDLLSLVPRSIWAQPWEETSCLFHSSPQEALANQSFWESRVFAKSGSLNYSLLAKPIFEATKVERMGMLSMRIRTRESL
jgi:hypothetical protein